ncbi:MAG TPA: ASCH domain-containing protein [Steroidobacteraceae bacterium]|jgi:hypothetical protein
MKALTIAQPYADMIMRGVKVIENRSWPTKYRGLMYIHAGKSRSWLTDARVVGMSFGAVVAIAELYDCVPVGKLPPTLRDNEHANGPWCWLLRNVSPIGPWPYRGAQGLFDINDLDDVANRELGIPSTSMVKP